MDIFNFLFSVLTLPQPYEPSAEVSSAILLLGVWSYLSVPLEALLLLFISFPSFRGHDILLPRSLPWSDQVPLVLPAALRNMAPYPQESKYCPGTILLFFLSYNWTEQNPQFITHYHHGSKEEPFFYLIELYYLFVFLKASLLSSIRNPRTHTLLYCVSYPASCFSTLTISL